MTESTDVASLLSTIAALEQRVRTLETERAQARIDAFVNAARIAEEHGGPENHPKVREMVRLIAARLRARAAVGVPPPEPS